MRTAKVSGDEVKSRVLASLCARMDPETHLVRPSWLTLMREIGVCRQRIADAVESLKASGSIIALAIPHPGGDDEEMDCVYKVVVDESGR